MRKQDDSIPPQLMDAVSSVPQHTELRQAQDGAWYPFDGDKDTPSYKGHYGDNALIMWEANFLEHKQAFILHRKLATVTSEQQSEVSPLACLSNHPAQKNDNFEWMSDDLDATFKDTFTESVPSSVEPTIIAPEPRSAVNPQSSEISAATECVVGLEPSATETTIVCPFHVLPRQQDLQVVWDGDGWVCLPPMSFEQWNSSARSLHPPQKVFKDTSTESVPFSVESTIISPELRVGVRAQSSEIAPAAGCVVGLEPSAAEITIVPPLHVLPLQQDLQVVWDGDGWVCLPPKSFEQWNSSAHSLHPPQKEASQDQ